MKFKNVNLRNSMYIIFYSLIIGTVLLYFLNLGDQQIDPRLQSHFEGSFVFLYVIIFSFYTLALTYTYVYVIRSIHAIATYTFTINVPFKWVPFRVQDALKTVNCDNQQVNQSSLPLLSVMRC